jgi:hypothetical protein
MPQSGQKTFENINSQDFPGMVINVPFSVVTFLYEQKRFTSEASGSPEPRAIF